jgi:hypothetical protein
MHDEMKRMREEATMIFDGSMLGGPFEKFVDWR